MTTGEWIILEEAQRRLKRGMRQVKRYVEEGRLRTRKRGVRIEYFAPDVDVLAATLITPTYSDEAPKTQIMPRGEMLMLIEKLQQQLAEAAAREGYLRGQLDQRPALEEKQNLMVDLTAVRVERDALRSQISDVRGTNKRIWLYFTISLIVVLLLVGVIIFR